MYKTKINNSDMLMGTLTTMKAFMLKFYNFYELVSYFDDLTLELLQTGDPSRSEPDPLP